MDGEGTPEAPPESELPDPVREWLARIAAERGLSERELLEQLLSSEEGASHAGFAEESVDRLDSLAEELDATDDRLETLTEELDDARDEFAGKIDDVRERVVQVKREADEKAAIDHGHPDIEGELDALLDEVEAIASDLDDLEADHAGLDDYVRTGFDNFETALEHLTDETEDLRRKLDRVAGVVMDVRERTRSLTRLESERAAVVEVAAAANRHGARTAKCDACGESVDIGLLHVPRCPHCEEGIHGFTPKQGFFGSHTLETGTAPALEGEVAGGADEDITAVVEDGASERASSTVPNADGTVDPGGADPGPEDDEPTADRTGERGEPGAGGASPSGASNGPVAPEPPDETPLRKLDGVGPTYADRLKAAGVSSVEELVRADADEVAAAVDVAASRVEGWISQGEEYVGG